MSLLPSDKEYLENRNYIFETHEEPNCTILIIKGYATSSIFDQNQVNVLIKIPKGYPVACLDMFWVQPFVKRRDTNNFPPQADVFEDICDSKWQRFSRHYAWQPTFSIANHLHVVKQELANEA